MKRCWVVFSEKHERGVKETVDHAGAEPMTFSLHTPRPDTQPALPQTAKINWNFMIGLETRLYSQRNRYHAVLSGSIKQIEISR